MNNLNSNKSDDKFSFIKSDLTKTIIFCGIVLVVFSFILIRSEGFFNALSKITRVFRPIMIGGIISFILNKPLNIVYKFYGNFAQNHLKTNKKKKTKPINNKRKSRIIYALSVVSVYIFALAIIALLLTFIIPQLIDSSRTFTENFEVYYHNFLNYANENFSHYDLQWLEELNILEKIQNLSFEDLSKYVPNVLKTTFGITAGIVDFTLSFVSIVVDFVVGIVFSIYILSDKQRLKKQSKDIAKAVFKPKTYERVTYYTQLVADTFTNFLSGQLTEAFLLGTLCFIGMTVIGFEYPLMISTIIAITNLVPIVGPIIGTIPGALILLLVNPSHAIWFVIFIIILQQLESNLMYPRVVGNSVGLPALWVLIAVLVGGGLGGVIGMIIGVPIMSIIYSIVKEEVRKKNEA